MEFLIKYVINIVFFILKLCLGVFFDVIVEDEIESLMFNLML